MMLKELKAVNSENNIKYIRSLRKQNAICHFVNANYIRSNNYNLKAYQCILFLYFVVTFNISDVIKKILCDISTFSSYLMFHGPASVLLEYILGVVNELFCKPGGRRFDSR
jgi:hypothetical protein